MTLDVPGAWCGAEGRDGSFHDGCTGPGASGWVSTACLMSPLPLRGVLRMGPPPGLSVQDLTRWFTQADAQKVSGLSELCFPH